MKILKPVIYLTFLFATMAHSAYAESDLQREAKIVKNHCASCHTFGNGEPNGQGPNLFGIVGRGAGKAPGYAYSPAFIKALSGRTWTSELLDAWLTDTQVVAPGVGMTYFQDDATIRTSILTYLNSLR